MADQAAESARIDEAYKFVERVPGKDRTQILEEIFSEEIRHVRLWIDGSSADLHRASSEARARAWAAGYEEELLEEVRKKNSPSWRRIVDWLDELEGDWEAIAPQGPLPETNSDPFAADDSSILER